MTSKLDRNLNPPAEAIAARFIWSAEYAFQRGGTLDFWEKLKPAQQRMCIVLVDAIADALKHGRRV